MLYSHPWPGGESHFSEPVSFMINGSIAVLRAASDSRLKWLDNIYQMGRDAIEAGQEGARYYLIPADQRHFDEAANLVNILLEGGIEVSRASESFRAGGERFAAGTYIIDAAQAFRPYILDLLEPQVYPDTRLDPNGDIKAPYDIAGWTLPMQMGVEMHKADSIDVASSPLNGLVQPPPGAVNDGDFGFVLQASANASARAANALLAAGDVVYRNSEAFRHRRIDLAPGSFVIESGTGTADRVARLAEDHGLTFVGIDETPDAGLVRQQLPRVALYKSYVASMDEGWTRWLLEDYGFDVVTLSDHDLRNGDLDGIDAIILPHPDGGVYFKNAIGKMLTGHSPGSMPDEYTGGMGLEGAANLMRFANDGGKILAFGDAVDFALQQFGLPVRDIVASAGSKDFSIPGSLIRTNIDTSNALAWGMDEQVAVNFVRGQAFDVLGQEGCVDDLLNQRHCHEVMRGDRPLKEFDQPPRYESVANYADEELLMSGWAAGTEHIAGKSALARVPQGDGEVIVYGFRPQFRGQPRATYKLVFNALYLAAAEQP